MALFSVLNLAPMALGVIVQRKLFQSWIICVDSQLFSCQLFSRQLFSHQLFFPWTPNYQKLQRRVPRSMHWETKKSLRWIKRCSAKVSLHSNQKSRNKCEWLCDRMVVVVVVIQISQECPRRCRCCRCCRRCCRHCRRRRWRRRHPWLFLCSIWRLSTRLRLDKKKNVGT